MIRQGSEPSHRKNQGPFFSWAWLFRSAAQRRVPIPNRISREEPPPQKKNGCLVTGKQSNNWKATRVEGRSLISSKVAKLLPGSKAAPFGTLKWDSRTYEACRHRRNWLYLVLWSIVTGRGCLIFCLLFFVVSYSKHSYPLGLKWLLLEQKEKTERVS